jgi:sarcosine oxidase subunit gamma
MTRKGNTTMTEAAMSSELAGAMESPLIGLGRNVSRELQVDGRSCTLAELPFLDMINLRGDAAVSHFTDAVTASTALALPRRANSATVSATRWLFWLGPDEWLLKLAPGEGAAMALALRGALAGLHHSVVEVGSGYTTFTVTGPAAADLLSRGCPLDLHPRMFGAGALAQSHVARSAALLYCVAPGSRYEITVRRSFAPYLFQWLCAAGD